MAILNPDFEPIGWGVFFERDAIPCAVLKPTEGAAMQYAKKCPSVAVVEQVFRRRPKQS